MLLSHRSSTQVGTEGPAEPPSDLGLAGHPHRNVANKGSFAGDALEASQLGSVALAAFPVKVVYAAPVAPHPGERVEAARGLHFSRNSVQIGMRWSTRASATLEFCMAWTRAWRASGTAGSDLGGVYC